MTDAPSGEVTFLFTDIEGSTGLWERHPDQMGVALAEHDRRLQAAVDNHGGYVFTTAGDSFAVTFRTAAAALAAAVEAQLSLLKPCGELDIRVRMAVHTGDATVRDGDYFGAVVNRSARLMSAGHGGQILLSAATADLVRGSLGEGLDLLDLGERRLKDLLRPEHIFQLRHPELASRFPDLKTLDGPWSNLPIQLTSFVGRDEDLVDVQKLLTANRLVTLMGTGGAGKTRLALQLAAEQFEDFPEGVRLVELAALTDPELVIDETAERFGVKTAPDVSPIDSIARKIGSQRMLLVLDNCEHLIDPVGLLAKQLLAACPSLKILATSREVLGVRGEVTFRVPSLPVPHTSDPEEARQYGSVQLFTERAVTVKPDFSVDSDNVDAVVAICQRLDGIPLAIELAAARLRILSTAQVAERLSERFRLLAGAKSTRIERHQTLLAAIDWSHDLLSEDERILFRRLSAFAGNFTLEAVEAVCSQDPLDSLAVLDLISELAHKSMINPDEAPGGETRYRLLESLRQYGADKLLTASESGEISIAHLSFYADLAQSLEVMWRGGEIGQALELLDQDEDNLRAALDFSFADARIEFAARIVGAIGYLWYVTGAHREGIDRSSQLLEHEALLPDELLAPALHVYALLLGSWEQPAVGIEILEREIKLLTRMQDPARLAAALNNLGNLLNDVGETTRGQATLRQAITQYRAADQPATLALVSLGGGLNDNGAYGEAEEVLTEALTEAETADDQYGAAIATIELGKCAAHTGRLDESRTLLESARSDFLKLGVVPGVADADLYLAVVDRASDKPSSAAAQLISSLESPDAHWYAAAKSWILQLAASIIPDTTTAARLIAVATAYYATVEEQQPAFIVADLAATRARLQADLGAEAFAAAHEEGTRLAHAEAIEVAKEALRGVAAT